MNGITLSFSPSGTGQCLYTEIIDLHTLGALEITRASTIEFNHTSQQWEVKQEDQLLYSDPSRRACLQWEQQHYNQG